ncbi:hypothetical protein HDU67_008721, partial [Dinochytrium kinnereticum]
MSDAHECLGLVRVGEEDRRGHVEELKKYFELYPFTDLAKDTSAPFFPSKIDLFTGLDTIAANTTITQSFDFHTRILLLLNSLNDAHISYKPTCFSRAFTFYQPWDIAPVYGDGRGGLRLRVVGTQAIQAYADKYAGFSREPDSRFNRVLTRFEYFNGSYTKVSGSFSYTSFLGHNSPPNRTYLMTSPDGKRNVTVTVPWLAVSNGPSFVNTREYHALYCRQDGAIQGMGRGVEGEDEGNDFLAVARRVGGPRRLSEAAPEWTTAVLSSLRKNAAVVRERLAGNVAATTMRFDLLKPVVSDSYNAFYLLDDGVTGVWVLSTFAPRYASTVQETFSVWAGEVSRGLGELVSLGARRLVLDVSGNGGGYVCGARSVARLFVRDAEPFVYDTRMTGGAEALELRDHGVRTFVYGGASRKPFTPTSFEGGVVTDFASLSRANLDTSQLTAAQLSRLPTHFSIPLTGTLPVNEAFSTYDVENPVEWVPMPADAWVEVLDPVFDKGALWRGVVEAMGRVPGGRSGRAG